MSKLVRSVVECKSCSYTRPWRDAWPWWLREKQLRRHQRRTGHSGMTLHQSWTY